MTEAAAKPLSIMHVLLEPRFAGAEMLVRDLVHIQAAEGHRMSIAAFRPPQENFVIELESLERLGCELHIPTRNLVRLGRLRWMLDAVKKAKPDVIFAHSILPSVYTRIALRLTRRPAVVTVLHTDDDLSNPWVLRLERLLYKRNACVVGVSSKSVGNYKRRMGDRVPLRVIRNGIRTERFTEPGLKHCLFREEIYRPAVGEIIALQVGRISIQKQQHVSVEALVRLRARGMRNIRLVMAGISEDATYQEEVLRRAREGGVEDQVKLVGPQRNIAEWLAGADIFLMPSAWEAHSVAALEAVASGVFCVFSGIEAFEDLRSLPGVDMIKVPPTGEDLAECIEQLVGRRAWESRYERKLDNFSVVECAREYLRIAEDFVAREYPLRV